MNLNHITKQDLVWLTGYKVRNGVRKNWWDYYKYPPQIRTWRKKMKFLATHPRELNKPDRPRLTVALAHPNSVWEARQKTRKLCFHCYKPLVPIGTNRANGKSHSDWKGRHFHKKCFFELNN